MLDFWGAKQLDIFLHFQLEWRMMIFSVALILEVRLVRYVDWRSQMQVKSLRRKKSD